MYVCMCPLVCTCDWERETVAERRRSALCARLPVTLWRWHTLLLDRWLGYSAGLAASSQERMEALCGRMSWTLWKGRSSQTEGKKEEKKTGGRMHKLVRRGKEGARRGRLTKQHPHTSPAALSRPRPPLSPYLGERTGGEYQFVGWGSCWATWVVSWFQRRCQWGPRRNRYLCLLSGHVELSQPCLQGLGGAPWPIILSSPFCLSHKEIYTTRFFQWACFTYTLAAHFSHCVWVSGYVRCALRYALAGMQTDLRQTYKQR